MHPSANEIGFVLMFLKCIVFFSRCFVLEGLVAPSLSRHRDGRDKDGACRHRDGRDVAPRSDAAVSQWAIPNQFEYHYGDGVPNHAF